MRWGVTGWTPPSDWATNSASSPFWASASRSSAAAAVSRLVDARVETADGPQWNVDVQFHLDLRILLSMSRSITQFDLMQALSFAPLQSRDQLADVETLLRLWLGSMAKEQSARRKRCLFALPLHATLDETIGSHLSISLYGERFAVVSRTASAVECSAALGVDWPIAPPTDGESAPLMMICSAEGADFRFAWKPLGLPVQIIRAAVEFHASYLRTSYGHDAVATLRALRLPKGIAVSEDLESWRWERPHYGVPLLENEQPEIRITPHLAGFIAFLERMFPAPPSQSSSTMVFQDCLRLYAQAVEQVTEYARLLHFWQLAEAITVAPDSRGDTDRVAKRMGALLQYSAPHMTDALTLLRALGKTRNEVVHRGVHDNVTQEDVNLFKLMCDYSLQWVMVRLGQLPTRRHLELFFERVMREARDLETIQDVERLIESENHQEAI